MARALKSNGADNIKKLHVRVDEGQRLNMSYESFIFVKIVDGNNEFDFGK